VIKHQVYLLLFIIPEMFQTGDFVAWLRQFECSANANTWDAAAKFRKLPAFLRSPAACYFHSLADAQKIHMHILFFVSNFTSSLAASSTCS